MLVLHGADPVDDAAALYLGVVPGIVVDVTGSIGRDDVFRVDGDAGVFGVSCQRPGGDLEGPHMRGRDIKQYADQDINKKQAKNNRSDVQRKDAPHTGRIVFGLLCSAFE